MTPLHYSVLDTIARSGSILVNYQNGNVCERVENGWKPIASASRWDWEPVLSSLESMNKLKKDNGGDGTASIWHKIKI